MLKRFLAAFFVLAVALVLPVGVQQLPVGVQQLHAQECSMTVVCLVTPRWTRCVEVYVECGGG